MANSMIALAALLAHLVPAQAANAQLPTCRSIASDDAAADARPLAAAAQEMTSWFLQAAVQCFAGGDGGPSLLRRKDPRAPLSRASRVPCRSAPLRMSGGGAEKPSIGFLGMGIMGVPMALNLVNAGFEVMVWNRSPEKCDPVVKAGATAASSAAEVVKSSDITFAMLSDPAAAEAVAFGEGGVVEAISAAKGYVDVSTVDPACATKIAAAVRAKGALYLEAPVSGSKKPAEDGALIFLCAGDKLLYDTATEALQAMGKKNLFLGEVGAGAKMKLVVNMVMGTMLSAFSEGLALADASDLDLDDVMDVINNGAMSCPMFALKGPQMKAASYPPAFPLKHAQKDMKLALLLADDVGVGLPTSAAANEQYKSAKGHGKGDDDFGAVHSNYQN